MKKRLFAILPLAIITVLGAGLWNFGLGDKLTLASAPQDCDDNAIVRCGIQSVGELRDKFNSNYRDIAHIYAAFGITKTEINHFTIKMGKVYKNGNVEVGGEVVATGATTVGRQNMPGSKAMPINGKTYYQRPPSASFRSEYIASFVILDKYGKFVGAVISSCGNPVKANPKPKPYYACTGLTATPVTGRRDQFVFRATQELHDVTFLYKTFTVRDSAGKTIQTIRQDRDDAHPVYTQAKPGNYSVEATITVKGPKGNLTTPHTGKCKVVFTVTPEPAKPEYACTGLTLIRIGQSQTSLGKVRATVTYSAKNGAQFKDVTFKATSLPANISATYPGSAATKDFTPRSPGRYRVEATVNFTVNGKTKSHTAPVCVAEIEIPQLQEPVYSCDELKMTTISRLERQFTVKATAKDGATIKDVTLAYGDGTQQTKPYGQTFSHTYTPGNYVATATVTFVVNGKEVKKTGPECKVALQVGEAPAYACTELSYITPSPQDTKTKTFTVKTTQTSGVTVKEVTLNYGDQTSETKAAGQTFTHTYAALNNITAIATVTFLVEGIEKKVTSPACQTTFSVLGEEECKPGVPRYLPSGQPNPECEEVEECKPGVPVGSPECEEECKPGVPVGSAECEEEEAPQVLAATGIESVLIGAAGTGALGYGIQNFTASRRALRKASLRK